MVDKKEIFNMPKAELHAHLNGSISSNTMKKLLDHRKECEKDALKEYLPSADILHASKTMEECFEVFRFIHHLTDNCWAIRHACIDVIKEFANENVLYLELRTTPRQIEGSFENYLDSVIEAIDQCREEKVPILVKLLPSIDRSKGLEMAQKVVELTIRYNHSRPDIIVGLDVSGNMTTSKMEDFFPLLSKVRNSGLKLAIHTAEVHNDVETENILCFKPDRIGHGTFIPPQRCQNPKLLELLKETKIPVELCLTSNLMCKSVSSYQDHHLKEIMSHGLPFTISTDDKGVFGKTLTDEYSIASDTFNLSLNQLWEISYQTLEHAFITEDERTELQSKWKLWKMQTSL